MGAAMGDEVIGLMNGLIYFSAESLHLWAVGWLELVSILLISVGVSRRCCHLALSCKNRSNVRCVRLVPQEKSYGFLTG